jgi:hypothetical protein
MTPFRGIDANTCVAGGNLVSPANRQRSKLTESRLWLLLPAFRADLTRERNGGFGQVAGEATFR